MAATGDGTLIDRRRVELADPGLPGQPHHHKAQSSVRQQCRPPRPGETKPNGRPLDEIWYWDTEDRGFFLAVRPKSTTFFVQRDVRGRTRRVKIGRYPTWTVDQARRRARELIVQMDQGVDPNAQKREAATRGTTLREAREWLAASMRARRCAERSMESVHGETDRHLADWLDRPPAEVRPNECARRHERITRDSGPYTRTGRCRRSAPAGTRPPADSTTCRPARRGA